MMDRTLMGGILESAKHRTMLSSKLTVQQASRFGVREDKRVVFMAGAQRSGTNMMMDILERSYQTDVYHERDQRAFRNYEMKDLSVIHGLVDRSPARQVVIKALCELQDLLFLLDEFNPARALWVVRRYDDVVNSMLVSFRNQAKQVMRIAEDRNSDGWRGRGMSDETLALVRKLVQPGVDDQTAAAITWYFRNILFFEQGLDTDSRVLLVEYDAVVSDPQVWLKKMFEFLGLNYSSRVSKKVSARSIRRRAAPAIDPRVREICDQLTDRFQSNLRQNSLSLAT